MKFPSGTESMGNNCGQSGYSGMLCDSITYEAVRLSPDFADDSEGALPFNNCQNTLCVLEAQGMAEYVPIFPSTSYFSESAMIADPMHRSQLKKDGTLREGW